VVGCRMGVTHIVAPCCLHTVVESGLRMLGRFTVDMIAYLWQQSI
jgi:hypothetical protein